MDCEETSEIIETEILIERTNFYVCAECHYETLFPFALEAHRKYKHSDRVAPAKCSTNNLEQYKCNRCDFVSCFYLNVLRHTKVAHEKNVNKNDIPKFMFLEMDSSKLAILSKDSVNLDNLHIFKTSQICYLGDHNYYFNEYSANTNKDRHPEKDTPVFRKYLQYCVKVFKCHKCDCLTNSKGKMENHVIQSHGFDELVIWVNCDEYLENYGKRIPKSYVCKQCDFSTNTKQQFSNHIRNNHDNVLYCGQCFFHTPNQLEMVNHHRYSCKVNKNSLCVCPKCLYKTTSKTLYDQHMARVHFIPFKCSCKFQTLSLIAFKAHTNNHTCHEAVVNDNDNDEVTSKKSGKERKTRLQQESNNPKITQNQDDHGKSEKFMCPHCGLLASSGYSLKSHIYSQHSPDSNINWFKCALCKYKSKEASKLKAHNATKHFSLINNSDQRAILRVQHDEVINVCD